MLALAYDFAFELGVIILIMCIAGVPACSSPRGHRHHGARDANLRWASSCRSRPVYFHDISHLWQIFNQIWMYASGVVFSLSMLNKVQTDLAARSWTWEAAPDIVTIFHLQPR